MHLVMLIGSGASIPAGMPTVDEITARVLSGDKVLRRGSDFRLVDRVEPHDEFFAAPVRKIIAFLHELQELCLTYFASEDKRRKPNYEDLAYIAGQIEDAIQGQYENPALLPLIERLGMGSQRTPDDLRSLAAESGNYISDIVCALLSRQPRPGDYLNAILDACADKDVKTLTLATLNHDVVLEQRLHQREIRYSDGFSEEFGTLRIWADEFGVPQRKLLKLHGSIDWWRYPHLARRGWTGQAIAQAIDGDPFHARDPNGIQVDIPAGRPVLLTGTFNKILQYASGIYADQQFRFHEALRNADGLVVIGYGFKDKAINSRIIAWAERPGERRIVVVHRNPDSLAAEARGAIRNNWKRWQDAGTLDFLRQHLGSTTRWDDVRDVVSTSP